MEKIVSLFQRNYDGDRLVRDEIVSGAEWVVAGEGIATRKFDGTCCRVKDGVLWKRYDAKAGKVPPLGFEPAQGESDPITGHFPGWVKVGEGSDDRWHREAWAEGRDALLIAGDATYELCGPKVQGNPEGFERHTLVRHGAYGLASAPRTYDGLRAYLADGRFEGIVWWHQDGRKVKIKARDFGFRRMESIAVRVDEFLRRFTC